jgi:surface protein
MKNLDQYILESLKGYKPGAIKPKEQLQLPQSCEKYFANQKVDVDEIENLDTSNVTNMESMFEQANFDLDSLDLSSWDVSNVTNMENMFHRCLKIEYLDLSTWDTSKVINMKSMFDGCDHLKFLDVSGWDTSNIRNPESLYTFSECYNLTDIRFGPGWGKNYYVLDLCDCGKNKGYKLSDETYESMLNMYDRKKAGLDPVTIYFNKNHNFPDGWREKMEERGYSIVRS